MASMIAENMYLIPSRVKSHHVQEDGYMVVCTDMERDLTNENDVIIAKIEAIKKSTFKSLDSVEGGFRDLKKYLHLQSNEHIQKQEMRNYEILARVDPSSTMMMMGNRIATPPHRMKGEAEPNFFGRFSMVAGRESGSNSMRRTLALGLQNSDKFPKM